MYNFIGWKQYIYTTFKELTELKLSSPNLDNEVKLVGKVLKEAASHLEAVHESLPKPHILILLIQTTKTGAIVVGVK